MAESIYIQSQVKEAIDRVRQVRADTTQVLHNSGHLLASYQKEQDEYFDRVENKKYKHLGNENFVKMFKSRKLNQIMQKRNEP